MKKENGFTLVEILVALFIGSMMMMAIYEVVFMAQRTSTGVERKVSAQQDARSALRLMSMEIGMASFNPNLKTGNWLQPADCTTVSGSQDNRGIQQATATAITVEMDMNEDCTEIDDPVCMRTAAANPNEIITYNYINDGVNRYITRETQCGGPQAFLGNLEATAAGIKTVRVVNADLNPPIPVFRYYNGAGANISGTVAGGSTHPVTGIPAIRRIEITLAVETEDIDPSNRARRIFMYSNSVIPRNHLPAP